MCLIICLNIVVNNLAAVLSGLETGNCDNKKLIDRRDAPPSHLCRWTLHYGIDNGSDRDHVDCDPPALKKTHCCQGNSLVHERTFKPLNS